MSKVRAAVTERPDVISLHEFPMPEPAPGAVIMKGHYSAQQAIELAQTDAAMKVVMARHGAVA